MLYMMVTNGDVIATWQPAAPLSLYKYELKSTTNSFTTGINSSRDNGTTFFEQTLVAALKKTRFRYTQERKTSCLRKTKNNC